MDPAASEQLQSIPPADATPAVDVRPVPRVSVQAFCDSQDVSQVIQEAGNDRRMAKANVAVHPGGISGALSMYANAPTPNVIILESSLPAEQMLSELDRLAEVCDAGTQVIVIGQTNDVILYRELIKRGISEYLVKPLTPLAVLASVSDLFAKEQSEPLGRVFAFYGAKGGVGSSTIAHNVAWAISQISGKSAVLLDLDLPFGTAGMDFNQDPGHGIGDAIFSSDRLDDMFLDRILSKCSDQLSLLAAPATLDREYDLAADSFDQIIELAQSSTPIVILDVPNGWSSWTKRVLTGADEIIVTASPALADLRNTKHVIDTLNESRRNDALPQMVLNQVGVPKRPEIKEADFVSTLNAELLATMPFEAQVFGVAANNGQMISEAAPKSKIAAQFVEIATKLTGGTTQAPSKSGLGSLLGMMRKKEAS